ncbi:DUF6948 domain-containing protein [Myxococcus landrumensis]|uniref:DUF6948 domain-containing protein n=1 Tax=Myxococcus landrumensis TaxID=2813577 RepID=A0ABX7N5L1_9BACT|nr:hypothetical protein [Myxococcus landrumus]QSQ14021.1 hypothetical protein JY572_37860 [Myxococcus landrumus]
MATKKQTQNRKVVVVAKPVGSNWARVMYGTLVEHDLASGTAVLEGARQALFYGRESGGEVGLAAVGPSKDSRLSPVAPGRSELAGVVLVTDATPEAVTAWSRA